MKLKDYDLQQYALNDGQDQEEDLRQHSLKNFDLRTLLLSEKQLAPAPIPAARDPSPFDQNPDDPSPIAASREEASPDQLDVPLWNSNEQSLVSDAPNPAPTDLSQLALDPGDVHFGPYFNLQTVSYTPLSRRPSADPAAGCSQEHIVFHRTAGKRDGQQAATERCFGPTARPIVFLVQKSRVS